MTKLCLVNCPCPEFVIPPRTAKDVDDMHWHKGCRVAHDGKECPYDKEKEGD